jgi:iron complex transport system ATP-binding protein
MSELLLEVENIKFKYRKNEEILKGISFQLEAGQTLSLLGANGCGKTTLMHLLLGFMRVDTGKIILKGKSIEKISVPKLSKIFSYVPQMQNFNFAYTVRDMVLMGRIPYSGCYRRYTKNDFYAADAALEKMQLEQLANKSFTELSGGQRQIVMIARAIAQDAPVCLMDEPENGLDYGNKIKLFRHIAELSNENMAFIITTHHPEHALWLNGEVLLMNNGLIMKKGKAKDCITSSNMKTLYQADITVSETNGRQFCHPKINFH